MYTPRQEYNNTKKSIESSESSPAIEYSPSSSIKSKSRQIYATSAFKNRALPNTFVCS